MDGGEGVPEGVGVPEGPVEPLLDLGELLLVLPLGLGALLRVLLLGESVARSGVAARPDLTRDEIVLIVNWLIWKLPLVK